jgi:YegS/Rv2252/BmrU family lipid kinase
MLFIFHPQTGGGRLKNKLMEIICRFSAAGYELCVWPTTGTGHARAIAASHAKGADMVVCCGGDGTLNEVVDALMAMEPACRPTVGYIPGGTTNDYATSLLLPKSDMLAAAERIIRPKKVYHSDVGTFNGRAFTYVAAFGAFTDISYKTPQNVKNALGYLAYLLEAVQHLGKTASCRARFVCSEESFEDDYLLGMVANSASVAGFHFKNSHKVRLDDGLFEVLLVKPPHNLGELGELSAALLGGNYASPLLTVTRVSGLRFESAEPISWTLDGEFGGSLTAADIQVHPRVLKICI